MNCSNCAHQNSERARFCESCGHRLDGGLGPDDSPSTHSGAAPTSHLAGAQGQAPKTSSAALWSLLNGLAGIFCFPIIPSILAIILGIVAHRNIRESQGQLTGGGMATAGIILGSLYVLAIPFIAILAAIAVPNFLEAQVRAKASKVRADHRALATAIESLYIDNSVYPAALDELPAGSGNLLDPFAAVPSESAGYEPATREYRYTLADPDGEGWMIWSAGPDGTYDLDGSEYQTDEEFPTPDLIEKTYDPSNGTLSSGDIWRTDWGRP